MSKDGDNLKEQAKQLQTTTEEKLNKVKAAAEDYRHRRRTQEESQTR